MRERIDRLEAITRICLIGPESTGKSALAQRLSLHLQAPWVREYAREYAEARGNRLAEDDVEPIARGQLALLDAPQTPAGLQVLDTDLISTVVYARHYYGRCPQWIAEEARARRADLYLLMATDVPWVADQARDAGGIRRGRLFEEFRSALQEFEARWVEVSGSWEERFGAALAHIATLRG